MNALSDLYVAVRQKEGRLYTDEVVAGLPHVGPEHPHHVEWLARRASAKRLLAYFDRCAKPLRMLDLGCGNGWLSATLGQLPGVRVLGLDTNLVELAQGARVFGAVEGAGFLAADVFHAPFREAEFAAVVMASSVQYFDDLPRLLLALQPLLTPAGEVHIIDSPFYEEEDVDAARRRTEAYYVELGFPEMAARYHHHAWSELAGFAVTLLHNPSTFGAKFQRRLGMADSPFPWLRVKFPR